MKIRITWEGGGWESEEFSDYKGGIDHELEELDDILPTDLDLNFEYIGGDILFRRAMDKWLEIRGGTEGIDEDAAKYCFEAAWFFYGLADPDKCTAYHYMWEDYEDDLDQVRHAVDNDDSDAGAIYVAASSEDQEHAKYLLYFAVTTRYTPSYIDDVLHAAPRDKVIAMVNEWNVHPIQANGQWWVTSDVWNPGY